ncbi:DUF58 domain-containing protein [Actinoallomurus soli]|uniref:DUF58 domain-containing protein n=1 Tax=Actinoallomurus soli TaxID=2952535 RepID=UPI00209272F4|nr:DUF58 domain-containing protein [Actinoallomurus soli]MCO5973457.1 DUF58 domain-containing protein [Actinoallomurus soli]
MLTPVGWGVAAVSAVLYAAGALLGYPEPVALAVGGLVAVVTAVLWTLPRPSLTVVREVTPNRVARGESASGVLHVTNTGRMRRAGMRAYDACGGGRIEVRVPVLRPGRAETIRYPLPTDRRGEIPVGPLRLVRADPFGLARRVREYGEPRTLLVRPHTVALPLLPSGRNHHLEGPTSDTAPAGTVTFHALREYVVGDDLRHIHWRSSARTGTLMVRQLVDASMPQTTVVVDTDAGAYADADDFELAVDAAASVAAGAAGMNFPVRVLTADGPLVETRGGAHDVEEILDRLAGLSRTDAAHGAVEVARRVRAGGALVLVTGGRGEVSGAGTLRRRFDRVVCVRVRPDAPGPRLPGVALVEISDLAELRAAWKGTTR